MSFKKYTPEQEKLVEHALTHFAPAYIDSLEKIGPYRRGTSYEEFRDVISEIVYSQFSGSPDENVDYLNVLSDIIKRIEEDIAFVEEEFTTAQVKVGYRVPRVVKNNLTEFYDTKAFLARLKSFVEKYHDGETKPDDDDEEETKRFRFLLEGIGKYIQDERGEIIGDLLEESEGEDEEEDDESEEVDESEEEDESEEKTPKRKGKEEEEEENSEAEDSPMKTEESSEEEATPKKPNVAVEEEEEEEDAYVSSADMQFVTPSKQTTGVKSSGLTGKLFKKLGLVRKTKSPSMVSPKEKKSKWWKKKKKKQLKKEKKKEGNKEMDEIELMDDMVEEKFGAALSVERGHGEMEKDLKKYRKAKSILKKQKGTFKSEELVKLLLDKDGYLSNRRSLDNNTSIMPVTSHVCKDQKTFKVMQHDHLIVKRRLKLVPEEESIRRDKTLLNEIIQCIEHFDEKEVEKDPRRNMIFKPIQIIIHENKSKPELECVFYVYNDTTNAGFRMFPNAVKSKKTYWDFMIDVITFVEYLHNEKGRPHLDLRPINCFYTRGFQDDKCHLKVITYGTTVNDGLGTKKLWPCYHNPDGEVKSFESDVYSFGLFLLYKGIEREIQNKRLADDLVIDPVFLLVEDIEAMMDTNSTKNAMKKLVEKITPIHGVETELEFQRRIVNVTLVACCTEPQLEFRPTPTMIKEYMRSKRNLYKE